MRWAGIVLLALGGACAATPPPPSPQKPSPAPGGSAGPGADGGARDPLADRLREITGASVRRDIEKIAVPRHHRSAPEGLATVATYVAGELERAGYGVTRQPVAYDNTATDNIIAERGAGKRVIVVCAHYDAVAGTAGA